MKELHPAQKAILDALKANMEDPLTIRELQELIRASSTSVVQHHILQLEKKGYLRRNPSNPRDYQILADTPDKEVSFLNLYGLAKCGPSGTLLDGSPIDRIPVPTRLLGFNSADGFLVRSKGDSMEPKIFEGDYVIARKNLSPNDGDIIVCSHNSTAKIKRIVFSSENKSILLVSFNPKYLPEVVNEDDLVIEGIVKGIYSYKFND